MMPYAYHTLFTLLVLPHLIFFGEVLLHHTTDLPISIEVLADSSLLVERATNFLGSTANGAVG